MPVEEENYGWLSYHVCYLFYRIDGPLLDDLRYFFYATPQFAYYVIPMSALVAALVTIGVMTKNSELVVMKACGISLYRVAAPILVGALAVAAVLFVLDQTILGPANGAKVQPVARQPSAAVAPRAPPAVAPRLPPVVAAPAPASTPTLDKGRLMFVPR